MTRSWPVLASFALTLGCSSSKPSGTESGTESGAESSSSSVGESDTDTDTETGGDPLEGIERDEGSFYNFDRRIHCVYAETLRPTTRAQVEAVVDWAVQAQLPIKVVSSPLSHSENQIICPDERGVQINLSQMNSVIELDTEAMTIEVEPGMRMGDIGDLLAEQNLALRTILPLRDFTAAGIIATGAHNSSLTMPAAVHDMVVGLEIIDGTGELQTLSGDEARHAAAHLGWLGAVVSVTFQAVPQYKTAYGLEKGDDAGLEDTILDMVAAHDYASVQWYPAQSGYAMSYHDVVPVDTPGDAYSTSWHSSQGEQLAIKELIELVSNDPEGEATICSIEASRFEDKAIGHEEDGEVVDNPVGFSHKMFASTCVDQECPWNVGSQAFNPELAIPIEQLPMWMARVREILAAKMACFPVSGILIRFSRASQSYMGSNADYDVAYVEWHIPRNPVEGKHEHFSGVYDELFQMTMVEFAARPHWAKNYWSTFAGLPRERYAHWDDFDALRAQLDPDNLFANPFWQLTYGELAVEHAPGCAIDRSCICEDDSHCGEDHQCLPGLVFTDARVCR